MTVRSRKLPGPFAFALTLATTTVWLGAQAAPQIVTSLAAGGWRLEIRRGENVKPGSRAPRHAYEVLRQAPGADAPARLFTETTTGRPHAFLRDDGLCFLDPVSAKPRLVFPDGAAVDHPLHVVGTPCEDWGCDDLHANGGGRVHFFGDDIVVVRSPGHLLQIARFRVDITAHTATPLTAILEVCGTGAEAQATKNAAMPLLPMLRLGDVLLWVNQGAGGKMQWERLTSPWRTRALRAFDLSTQQFVDVATLPDPFFLEHHVRVLTFLEQEAQGHAVEFEAWGIRRIGELGLANDFDRVLRLLGSAQHAMAEWNGDGAVTDDLQRLRSIYLRTLQQLNG